MTGGGHHESVWLTADEREVIGAACELVVGGSGPAGAADYVDQLLGAFAFRPPRIWAGGPFSGRHGGVAGFERWLELGAAEELAWRIRIEGSQGLAEREFNGAVTGWQEIYRTGIDALGPDFCALDDDARRARLDSTPEDFRDLLFAHACESLYGDPVYGGNRDRVGWRSIEFVGDTQPTGWTDVEVTFGGRGEPDPVEHDPAEHDR